MGKQIYLSYSQLQIIQDLLMNVDIHLDYPEEDKQKELGRLNSKILKALD